MARDALKRRSRMEDVDRSAMRCDCGGGRSDCAGGSSGSGDSGGGGGGSDCAGGSSGSGSGGGGGGSGSGSCWSLLTNSLSALAPLPAS